MKVLCIGDVVARPGRDILTRLLPQIRSELSIDFVIVNGENAAGGTGIDWKCYRELVAAGADVITLGDHTWRRPEVRELLGDLSLRCLCPGNYPPGTHLRGWGVFPVGHLSVGVVNVLGRTFLQSPLDCPFRYLDGVLHSHLSSCDFVIVDFHGEATSEKIAFARHFTGRVSLIFGTHTHVPTADHCILSGQTAYVTDLGMTGSHAGVIGLDKDVAINRFLSGIPSSYKPAEGEGCINGILVHFDIETKKPLSIERFLRRD